MFIIPELLFTAPPGILSSIVIPPEFVPFILIVPLFSNLDAEARGLVVRETTIPWLLLPSKLTVPSLIAVIFHDVTLILGPSLKSLVANPAELAPFIWIVFLLISVWLFPFLLLSFVNRSATCLSFCPSINPSFVPVTLMFPDCESG